MKFCNLKKDLEVLRAESMIKLRGGYYDEDGQPIGETKGDPPPVV
ncbi:MAG: hypothetical protein WBB45_09165 [Cyclobacteriaceae bacterium]